MTYRRIIDYSKELQTTFSELPHLFREKYRIGLRNSAIDAIVIEPNLFIISPINDGSFYSRLIDSGKTDTSRKQQGAYFNTCREAVHTTISWRSYPISFIPVVDDPPLPYESNSPTRCLADEMSDEILADWIFKRIAETSGNRGSLGRSVRSLFKFYSMAR